MKTLHIHIGTAKTATTAIQAFCKENAKVFRKKGYCYPIFPFRYSGKAKSHNGSFLQTAIRDQNGMRDKEQEKENFKKGMKTIHRLFWFYDNVVLSDEGIWRGMDMERKRIWKKLLQEAEKGKFRLHVVVYLRRQDEYYLSHWNQQVKKRCAQETVEEYFWKVDTNRGDYYGKLERMAAIVGKENITVRRFENGKFKGGSIYSDFLDAIGLSMTEEYHVSDKVRNPGLYGNTVEIKRVLNALPQMKEEDIQLFMVQILWECERFSKKEYPCTFYDKEKAEKFLSAYLPGNKKVAEEYLHEPGADLFDVQTSELPTWQKDNPYMIDDLIRFAGEAIMCLYQKNRELRQELEEMV